jgi:hypothetical protein
LQPNGVPAQRAQGGSRHAAVARRAGEKCFKLKKVFFVFSVDVTNFLLPGNKKISVLLE